MSRKPKLDRALDWAIGIALVLAVAVPADRRSYSQQHARGRPRLTITSKGCMHG